VSTGIEGFAGDLATQSAAVRARSPVQGALYAVVLELLDGWLGAWLAEAWRGREFGVFYERPLLLLASLRYDALAAGPGHPLFGALAAPAPDPGAIDAASLAAALQPERPGWRSLSERFVQTNETSRAVAWLWPAAGFGDQPFVLVDVGCSAGLNLIADALPKPWTSDDGAPLPVAERPRIVERIGLDARPLDVTDDDAARWVEACVWPGETARLERLAAALAAFRRAPIPLETMSVVDAPARIERALAAHPEARVLAYQTVVRDYLPNDVRAAYERGMRVLPARALWIELELGGAGTSPALTCSITAHEAGEVRLLGHCGYHPSAVAVAR
jgi:hypothetical protein